MAESTHSSHSVMDKLKDKLTHRGVHKDTARHTDTLDEAGEGYLICAVVFLLGPA